jgi:hypothetical protein
VGTSVASREGARRRSGGGGCGGGVRRWWPDDDDHLSGDPEARARRRRARPDGRHSRRHAHRPQPPGLPELRSGPGLFPIRLRGRLCDPAAVVLVPAESVADTLARPGIRPCDRERRRQDGHRPHQARRPLQPTVGREVTSADVAYAIERGANPNVANPYFARTSTTSSERAGRPVARSPGSPCRIATRSSFI